MRRKLLSRFTTAQMKLAKAQQSNFVRVTAAAELEDFAELQEAIAYAWEIEHHSQIIAQDLYVRRHEQLKMFARSLPEVSEDCEVTLNHRDTMTTLRFTSSEPTRWLDGNIGIDCYLGRQLHRNKLMGIISIPTPLGEKTYQIVAISKVPLIPRRDLLPDAIRSKIGTRMRGV